jgi:putative ABC transport system permease protein
MAAIVGEGVAELLALRPGSAVTVLAPTIDGAMNTLELDVVGVFRSFSKEYDARTVKVPIGAAKELLATPSAMKIVVLLDRTSDTGAVAARLTGVAAQRGLVVRDWEQLNDFYQGTVELYDRQFGVLNLIILVMVVLGVSNSVYMSVLERLGEFGTLQAIGLRKGDIVRLIMAETVLLGLVGAAAGAAVGIGVALASSAYGIPMPPPPNSNAGYTASIRIVPAVVATAVAVGFTATLIAGLMPAWRVARTPIVEALRENV